MRFKKPTAMLLPPLIFSGQTASEKAQLTKLKKSGLVRKIGPRLYTSVPPKEVSDLVRGSWALIVSKLFPNILISHATALTYLPSQTGEIFLTSTTQRQVFFSGLTLKFMRGPLALKSDIDFMFVKASSFERALLENLSLAKGGLQNRVLAQEDIEARIELFLLQKGEAELNSLRDRARRISNQLKLYNEFKKLDQIIGSLLSSGPLKNLKSENARARSQGLPFDSKCTARFEILFGYLRHLPMKEMKNNFLSAEHFLNKAFFEAYFSNYIEGTIFEIDEAENIIFDKKIPNDRPIDAHDILGTFKIVSDPNEMKIRPATAKNFEAILKYRHSILLQKRTDVRPGEYKKVTNRAGGSIFVHPEYIQGTLHKGFDFYESLPQGLARAIFMMFLVSEVHPFNDGNGRISRVMMNVELHSAGLSSIIIPNVFREDYLSALKALSRRDDPKPFVKMLAMAHSFSCIDFKSYSQIKKKLKSQNWFEESSDAKIIYDYI